MWYFVKHPSLKFGHWLPFLAVLILAGIFDSVLAESRLQFESGFSECYYPHSFKTKIKYSGNSVTDLKTAKNTDTDKLTAKEGMLLFKLSQNRY